MAEAAKAIGYLELNSKQFEDAIATAKKLLIGLGAAFAAVKTVDFWKDNIEGAIKFGNEAYFAAQKLNGYDPGKLLLVQKALERSGESAAEATTNIEEFGRAGRPLEQLFKGGSGGFQQALTEAAKEYGTQAAVLSKAAEEFAYVQQQIVDLGTKMQGFFLGLADQISRPLSSLLAEIDKIDLVGLGEKFGSYIVTAINTVKGLIAGGNFLDTLKLGLRVGFQEAANYLLGAVNTVVDLLTNGDTWAGIGSTLVGALGIVGTFLTSLFLGIGKLFVATIQSALAQMAQQHPWLQQFVGGKKLEVSDDQKQRAMALYGNVIGPQKIAQAQGIADAYNAAHPAYSTDVSENLKSINSNSAIQAMDKLSAAQMEMAKSVAKGGLAQLEGIHPAFKKASLYDTDKDSASLTAMLAKANAAGAASTGPDGKKTPTFSERPDPFHVIADSLARVGGGGRYVRTGLSIAEKAAMDSARYNKQQADIQAKYLPFLKSFASPHHGIGVVSGG